MKHVEDPLELFREWYAEARRSEIGKPHAMALATTGSDGRPATRMVLLSSFDERGFVFHTNDQSRKAEEIAGQPWVALLFWWDALGYQVRVEGRAAKTSPDEADAYFKRRPRGSQLSAWASEQSRVVAGREEVERRMGAFAEEYAQREVPRPPHWGGYRVYPEVLEFWREGDDRLHDRVRFRRTERRWVREYLAP